MHLYKIEKVGNHWYAINTATSKAEKVAIYKRACIDYVNEQASKIKMINNWGK